jgi:hypothetical protein
MIGREHGRQEDGEQARDAEHDAVEELPVAASLLVLERLPQQQARERFRRHLGHERHGLAGLDREAEDVGAVVLDALGHEANGGRHHLDAAGVEVGPHDARADRVVAIGRQPALDRLVGGVGESEHEPAGIGARRGRAHRHAAADAVEPCRGLDLQRIALAVMGLAEARDVDAIGIVVDADGLEGVRLGHAGDQRDNHGQEHNEGMPAGGQRRHHAESPARAVLCLPPRHSFLKSLVNRQKDVRTGRDPATRPRFSDTAWRDLRRRTRLS